MSVGKQTSTKITSTGGAGFASGKYPSNVTKKAGPVKNGSTSTSTAKTTNLPPRP